MTRFSDNFGVPSLVLFLVIGMLAGSDGPGKIYFDNAYAARYVGIVALVFILFSGGLSTKWFDVKSVLWSGFSLSTVGIVVTALSVGFFIHYFFNLGLVEGLLIGAIVSSTDAAAVFSVLRSKGTTLKGRLKPLLELESGSNDPAAIILTVILVGVLQTGDFSIFDTIVFLLVQLLAGGAVGYFSGKLISFAVNKLKFAYPSLYIVFALASAIFVYSFTITIQGSGFLAVYVCAIVLGNSEFVQKKSLVRFFDGFALLGQVVVFLTLGLLVFPSRLVHVVGAGLIISAILMFIARPAAVYISLIKSKFNFAEKAFISWVGLRGAVPVILATFPLAAGLEIGNYIFNLVFFITLTSALVQGWSIPLAAKIFGVKGTDQKESKIPIEISGAVKANNELLDLIIPESSDAAGKSLAELNLPLESLITVIYRDNEYVVPSGSSTLEAGDTILVLVNKNNIDAVRKVFTKMKKS
jgi:cell volume regulation protein A